MSKRRLPYRFKTTPFDHQLSTWELTKDETAWGYLFDMGCGKTKLGIDVAAYLYDTGKINAVLVFSNKGSYTNWVEKEIPEHMPEHIRYAAYSWDNRKTQKVTQALRHFVQDDNGLKIFAMNIEALAYERSAAIAHKFARIHRTLTIVDESTTIKNIKAKRTKVALQIGKVSIYKRIMTGMAVENSPLDVYSQCLFLGPYVLGFSSYYAFRAHYAYLQTMTNAARSYKIVVGYKNIDELKERLGRHCTIIKSEDCLDLPAQRWTEFKVELSPEQKKIYAQMRDRAIAEITHDKSVTAAIVLTKLLRLHQIVCGFVTDDDGLEHSLPNNRMEALDAILDETGGAIIWANYRHNLKEIVKHLSEIHGEDRVAHYYGDTTKEERETAKRDFQSGKLLYLVANAQTAGYGLTLTRANTAVYFSNSYNLGHRAQSEKRCHRIGQTRDVTYVDLVTPGTVDAKIIKSLKDKRSLSDRILETNYSELF